MRQRRLLDGKKWLSEGFSSNQRLSLNGLDDVVLVYSDKETALLLK